MIAVLGPMRLYDVLLKRLTQVQHSLQGSIEYQLPYMKVLASSFVADPDTTMLEHLYESGMETHYYSL